MQDSACHGTAQHSAARVCVSCQFANRACIAAVQERSRRRDCPPGAAAGYQMWLQHIAALLLLLLPAMAANRMATNTIPPPCPRSPSSSLPEAFWLAVCWDASADCVLPLRYCR